MARTKPARPDEPAWMTAYFAAQDAADNAPELIVINDEPVTGCVTDLPYSAQF